MQESLEKNPLRLFSEQKIIFPKRVWGKFRKIKWIIMTCTLFVYYFAPWIRWDRGPQIPNQAILIDMPNRRAYFFFIEIWPQEIYFLTGILIFLAVALFLSTSLVGRAWCGYACPQTVWTDLFVWVERIFQGDRNSRMKLSNAPISFNKIWRKLSTHIAWIVIAILTGGAWVFYFNDAPTLLEQIINFDVPWSVLSWIVVLTFSTYLMAGFAREQVCTYMCPYARFQSAMFDRDTLIISYDEFRGEPRGKHKAGDSWENKGHCINCTECIQVCPVGIDIRKGLQMECIACGLCIDACNKIMKKINLPAGLIRYDTEKNKGRRFRNEKEKKSLLRGRTYSYLSILLILSAAILYMLLNRSILELNVLHDRNPLFVKLSNGQIRNSYDIKILNKSFKSKKYSLSIEGLKNSKIKIQGIESLSSNNLPVVANSVGHYRIFLIADKNKEVRKKVIFNIKELDDEISDTVENIFISGKY